MPCSRMILPSPARTTMITSAKPPILQSAGRAAKNVRAFHILNLIESGDEALIRYECELKDGERFRNTEYFRAVGDQIHEIDVYFGRTVTSK